jgi:superoxide dismutase, Fe-Mn family
MHDQHCSATHAADRPTPSPHRRNGAAAPDIDVQPAGRTGSLKEPTMKRALLSTAAFLAAACLPALAAAQFALFPLPYAADALEPHIDRKTMEIHHGRHHAAYVNNLNAQVKNFPELAGLSLEELQGQISKFNTAVRNNGGGHYNHDLFWKLMAPEGRRGKPSAALEAAVIAAFGSLEEMKKRFDAAALDRFGSGWAWLIVTPDKQLAVTSTPNQDNPLMDVPGIPRGTPILALDVWEHAYYLKYQNNRATYVTNWWNVVDWNEVNTRFEAAVR